MLITDLLAPERVLTDVRVRSKKRVLELVAARLCRDRKISDERAVYSSLCARERIGSTALGHGVAIPHGRLAGLEEATGVFLKLTDAIDFDAPDGQPVDLIFAMIVPEDHEHEHLQLLAQLAETFSNEDHRDRLRSARNGAQALDLLEAAQVQRAS